MISPRKKTILTFVVGLLTGVVILFLLRDFAPGLRSLAPLLENFVVEYGLLGGFVVSFVGSLWFILAPYEIALAPVFHFYANPVLALLVFSAGATLADVVNFYSGRKFGAPWVRKKIKPKTLERIQRFLDKWGVPALLFFGVVGPVTSYDAVALIMGGISKMKPRLFFAITIIARILHFSVVWFLATIFFSGVGV